MDHSLGAYLRRRTTKELEEALAYYLQGENYIDQEHVVREILKIFRERDGLELLDDENS